MDEFIECLKEASSASCGQAAGDWIRTAKQIYFAPTKRQLQCADTRTSSVCLNTADHPQIPEIDPLVSVSEL